MTGGDALDDLRGWSGSRRASSMGWPTHRARDRRTRGLVASAARRRRRERRTQRRAKVTRAPVAVQ
jgi:hypothetical protein